MFAAAILGGVAASGSALAQITKQPEVTNNEGAGYKEQQDELPAGRDI